jgi:pimeloyl-ACP methyl ester carboxylesterase
MNKIYVLSLGIIFLVSLSACTGTPPIKDTSNQIVKGSISSLEKVNLGGIEQWILIRGRNTNNPILLMLHGYGGPGICTAHLEYDSGGILENHFTIVYWDQRGTGKSFSDFIPPESMNIEQLINDTHELMILLMERFQQKKVFLLGESWGSILGAYVAQKYPELVHAFISSGQAVNMRIGLQITHNYLLKTAHSKNNRKAIQELENISIPTEETNPDEAYNSFMTINNWLEEFGGAVHNESSNTDISEIASGAPEYSLFDFLNFFRGWMFFIKATINEVMTVNLIEQVPELAVPVYICHGRFDYYSTPYQLVDEFFEKLKSPHKELIWFEESAHMPRAEEPDKFEEILIKKILGQKF